MKPERRREIEAVFQAALEHEPAGREAFLDKACSSHPDLRSEVESLLKGDAA